MSGGVLALFGVCLGVAILELALPGEEGREGPKRFLRFFAALVVLLLILRPIFPFSSTEGGCLAGALDGSGGAVDYEQILQEAVSQVSGAEVMVTLESGYRVVYASDGKGEPATVGSGNKQQALQQTLRPPAVAGVAVVCHGGKDPDVRRALVELISTALGISSNRVFVAGK